MWEVYAITNWQWWANLLLFGISIAASWFIPGLVTARWLNLPKALHFVVAPIIGISFWALQGYILGWIQIRWATYVYLAMFLFLFWQQRKHLLPIQWRQNFPKPVWALIFLGVILQVIPVFGSGWMGAEGVRFFFITIFDGVFHLSLARALVENVPPMQPGAIDLPVTNYHYLSNLVMAELTRVWRLPLNHIYFHYLPIFGSLWVGISTVALLRQWSKNTWTVMYGLLLIYVVGELSWLVDLLLGRNSSVPFEVFIDNGVLQFLNPPQAFAKLTFLGSLILLSIFWKKPSIKLGAVSGAAIATLIGFKIYFGIGAAVGLVAAVVFLAINWLRSKQRTISWYVVASFATLAACSATLGALIYLPTNSNAGGLFFDLLTWPKLLLGASKLNWSEWWLRMQVYEQAENTKAIWALYAAAITVFLVSIFHIRLIGLAVLLKRFRQSISSIEVVFLLVPTILFSFIGMNYLQTSGGANSFNFFVVALVMLNLLTAVVLGKLAEKKWLAISFCAVLLLTLVQTVYLHYFYLSHYAHTTDSLLISNEHLDALDYLKSLPDPVVAQTVSGHAFDQTTPYFYFFTGRRTYFGGRGILASHNQPIADRQKLLEQMFGVHPYFYIEATTAAKLANDVGITHLLLTDGLQDNMFYEAQLESATQSATPRWSSVFENSEVLILKPILN